MSEDRAFWNNNYGVLQDPNEVFFAWYDDIRRTSFNVNEKLNSLEIGPGAGYFTRIANVNIAVDVSISALMRIKTGSSCQTVVADAFALPFCSNSFDIVYTNDVMHHLKAQGVISCATDNIKRIIKNGGLWCVSDRRPSLYNSLFLKLNSIGRYVCMFLLRVLGKKIVFSGSNQEPPMEKVDYESINNGMIKIRHKYWKNWFVFFVYGFFQFARLILPRRMQFMLARILVRLCAFMEALLPDIFKSDVCIVLKKANGEA